MKNQNGFRFWLFCFLAYFIAFHFTTLSHEFLGHGVTALLMGGKIDDFHINLMGASGYVSTTLNRTTPTQDHFFQWGGIGITAVFFILLWFYLSKHSKISRADQIAWIVLGCLLSSTFGYCTLGLYYAYGDPREAATWLKQHGFLGLVLLTVILLHACLIFFWAQNLVHQLPLSQPPPKPHINVFRSLLFFGTPALLLGSLNWGETQLRNNFKMEITMASQRQLDFFQKKRWERLQQLPKQKKISPRETQKMWEMTRKAKMIGEPTWKIEWIYYPLLLLASLTGLWKGSSSRRSCETPLPPDRV